MAHKIIIILCKAAILFGLGWILFGLANLFLFNCLFEIFEFKEARLDKLVINTNYDPTLFGIYYKFNVENKIYSETYMIPKDRLLENYETPKNIIVIYNTFFPRVNYIKGFRQSFREGILEIGLGIFFCLFFAFGMKKVKAK